MVVCYCVCAARACVFEFPYVFGGVVCGELVWNVMIELEFADGFVDCAVCFVGGFTADV